MGAGDSVDAAEIRDAVDLQTAAIRQLIDGLDRQTHMLTHQGELITEVLTLLTRPPGESPLEQLLRQKIAAVDAQTAAVERVEATLAKARVLPAGSPPACDNRSPAPPVV